MHASMYIHTNTDIFWAEEQGTGCPSPVPTGATRMSDIVQGLQGWAPMGRPGGRPSGGAGMSAETAHPRPWGGGGVPSRSAVPRPPGRQEENRLGRRYGEERQKATKAVCGPPKARQARNTRHAPGRPRKRKPKRANSTEDQGWWAGGRNKEKRRTLERGRETRGSEERGGGRGIHIHGRGNHDAPRGTCGATRRPHEWGLYPPPPPPPAGAGHMNTRKQT